MRMSRIGRSEALDIVCSMVSPRLHAGLSSLTVKHNSMTKTCLFHNHSSICPSQAFIIITQSLLSKASKEKETKETSNEQVARTSTYPGAALYSHAKMIRTKKENAVEINQVSLTVRRYVHPEFARFPRRENLISFYQLCERN